MSNLSEHDAFGHWLAGFTAGEGSFNVNVGASQVSSQFVIKVRSDDWPILETIRERWHGIGSLTVAPARGNSAPMAVYIVGGIHDLPIVVRHFQTYPLRSSKAADFVHWSAAVNLHARVSAKPFRRLGYCLGVAPKWTPVNLLVYRLHRDRLHSGRVFHEPAPDAVASVSLFDEGFQHWLAGFIAAEGCLNLRIVKKTTPVPRLQIKLRADDLPILLAIQRFFAGGRLYREESQKANPVYCYHAVSNETICNHVLPFLVQYPLRSRKAVEVPVWLEAINYCYQGRGPNPSRQTNLDAFRQLQFKLAQLKTFAT